MCPSSAAAAAAARSSPAAAPAAEPAAEPEPEPERALEAGKKHHVFLTHDWGAQHHAHATRSTMRMCAAPCARSGVPRCGECSTV